MGLGVAGQPPHPLQPRLGRPRGPPVVRAQGAGLVGRRAATVGRPRHARLRGGQAARLPARRTTRPARTALAGTDPFIMQADGTAGCSRPAGRRRRAAADALRAAGLAGAQPAVRRSSAIRRGSTTLPRGQPLPPDPGRPGSDVFPYAVTTYRLTEHFTAGGMSRWMPYLSELQPEFFCEVSPELAAERGLEHPAGRRSSPPAARSRRGCWSPSG